MSGKNFSVTNPYFLLTITTLLWGGNAVAGKLANGHISPFLLTSCRWTLTCIILLPFSWKYIKQDWPIIRKNLFYLFACGAIGFAMFNNFLYLALTYTTALNAAIEQAAMPLVVFALNYLIFKTRTTAYQIIGFSITLVGVLITITRGDIGSLLSGDLNFGDLLMIFAVVFYGVYSVILRSKPDIHLLSFLSVLAVSALFVSVPFTVYEASSDALILPTARGIGIIIYAALFASIISQLFWVMGLEKIGSNRGGLFINLVPVFGAILAILILGEQFQFYHALGFILVLGGIMLAQKTVPKA